LAFLLVTGVFTGALTLGVQSAHASPSTTPQKGDSVPYNDPVCISNGYLAAQVIPPADTTGVGVTWFEIGDCSTPTTIDSTDIPITYYGGDNFVSVNVFDTNSIYVTGLCTGIVNCSTTQNGENVWSLDSYAPTLLAATSNCPTTTCIAIQWSPSAGNQGLLVTQTISIAGSTAATSAIFQTVSVTNPSTNTASHTVGVRYLWDYDVNSYDGTWIQEYNGVTPGSILGVETDFPNPGATMTAYAMGPCAGAPPCTSANFGSSGGSTSVTAYGSISSPTGVTVPSDYVYGAWPSQQATAYFYTANVNLCSGVITPPNPIGNGLLNSCDDSSGLYFFGGPSGTVIAPGQTVSYTAAISNAASSVALATPTLSTLLSAASIAAGNSVSDSATLTGATGSAGGTVTYYYTTDSTCATGGVQVGSPVTVTAGIVPGSASQPFSTAGNYYWYAVYSGDSGNTGTTSPCNEPLTVSSGTTSTTTVTTILTTTHTSTATAITTSIGTTTITTACDDPLSPAGLSLATVPVVTTTVTSTTTVTIITTTTSTVHTTVTATTCTTSTSSSSSSSSSTTTARGVPEFPLNSATSFLVLALLLPVLAVIGRLRRTRMDLP